MPLSDLREKYRPESDDGKVPLPPLPSGYDVVVAFDQALDKCGVVSYDGTNVVAWTIRSPEDTKDATGHERTLRRSVALQEAVLAVLSTLEADYRRILVLHETPAVAKGGMRNTESSLLAAHCVRWATIVTGLNGLSEFALEMVSAQSAKGAVTGNPRADKSEVRDVLTRTYDPRQVGACTNNDERDALALIVTYCKRST